jgi:DNA-binding transcriptional ArsR family regulator
MCAKRRKTPREALGLEQAARLFAALGDETRIRVVDRMASSVVPLSISELTTDTGVTRQAITKHLKVLADAGLARGIREGRESLWTLEPSQVRAGRRALKQLAKRSRKSRASPSRRGSSLP